MLNYQLEKLIKGGDMIKILRALPKVFVLLLFFNEYASDNPEDLVQRAVFIAPVTDLFFDQLSRHAPKVALSNLYYGVPLASNNSVYGCMRATQVLFNQVVTIVKESGSEVCIHLERLFYDAPDRSAASCFWTLKKNLLTFDQLKKMGVDTAVFPKPIVRDVSSLKDSTIVTLTLPWLDGVTGKEYSPGTRFVREAHNDTDEYIAIKLFDTNNRTIKQSFIPRDYCFLEKALSTSDRQKAYVALIKKWALELDGIVPYVWGGASLVQVLPDDEFYTQGGTIFNGPISYWVRPGMRNPKTGFDCSGLIACAAQICGIPYFFKNTLTLANHLRPLAQGENIEEGDLIWYAGHVMVVSDLKKNQLIEASGYPSGHGKLQSIALSKKFMNINKYSDLVRAYHAKKPVKILNKDGKVMREVGFMLYKFSSVWQNNY